MRNLDQLVDTHRAAAELRSQGKPIWQGTVDLSSVYHEEFDVFADKAQAVAQAFRASGWVRGQTTDSLMLLVEELEESEDVEVFDCVMSNIYDAADYDRVWIKTR